MDKNKVREAIEKAQKYVDDELKWSPTDEGTKQYVATFKPLVDLAQSYLNGELVPKGEGMGEDINIERIKVQLSDRKNIPYEILLDGMVIALCPTEEISIFIVNALSSKVNLQSPTKCPMCKGNGLMTDGTRGVCLICDGSGKIPAKKVSE